VSPLPKHRINTPPDRPRHPHSDIARYAAELGYEVTVVKDATADYSDEMMHAALDINMPNYATAIVTTEEVIASISSL
jgi:nicotinamidase-related amidase